MAEPTQTPHQTSGHAVYRDLAATDEFHRLRKAYRAFAIPWTVAFLAWYLLYVILSIWANDFMSLKVVGNINVALVLGLLQFASTFLIAWLYSRHAAKALDPLARTLERRYDAEVGR
ncbi:DUF485 domain-containing protein [Nocardioides mesophilus]|uniref:DUF485 domain-containing protein n=1 Tax=Nocardioides mesophilus TaxID=433659 RepID=A0A7G9RGD4_9ACTN|nr:DUF485 domain-containing protein [Nocardioides mesophilus]QNN54659.1 DUF485 domain-containing protein [Nocardioides mesophilus]